MQVPNQFYRTCAQTISKHSVKVKTFKSVIVPINKTKNPGNQTKAISSHKDLHYRNYIGDYSSISYKF